MNPYGDLESEKTRIENKSRFLIDNRQKICEHGGLHPMIARNGEIYPRQGIPLYERNIYKKMGI